MIDDEQEIEFTHLHLAEPYLGQTLRVGTTVFVDGKWYGPVDDANLLMRMSRFYPVRRGVYKADSEEVVEDLPDPEEKGPGPVTAKERTPPATRRRRKVKAQPDKVPPGVVTNVAD